MIKLQDAIPVICLEKAKNTEKQVFLAFIDTIMILFLIFASQPNPNASRSTSLSQVFWNDLTPTCLKLYDSIYSS